MKYKGTADYIKNVMHYWGINFVQTIPIAYRSYVLQKRIGKRL